MHSGTKQILKRILKVTAWVITPVILLLVLGALLIGIPSVQTWLTQKATSFLEDKIGTEVSLGGISIGFPKSIILEEVYFEDQKGDTLLYAEKISVDTDLWALTRNEIRLNDVRILNTLAVIDRAGNDSAFNFTYIPDAFASDPTAVPDTPGQKGWSITLESLELEGFRVRFNDRLQGNFMNLALGHLRLDMRTFDLGNNSFAVEDIILEDTRAQIRQTKLLPPTKETEEREDSAAALIFSLDEFLMTNVNLSYEQTALGQLVRLEVGEVKVLADRIDLPNREIALNSISITESFLALHNSRPDTLSPQAEQPTADAATVTPPWKINLNELELEDIRIEHFDLARPRRPGLDFHHLALTGLNISASDLGYNGENIKANLDNLSFREQSGFAITSLEAKINITGREAAFEDFLLTTGNSRLELQAYSSFKTTWQEAVITSDINNSYINVRDILYFNPAFPDSLPLTLSADTNLKIDATVRGRVADLEIQHLNIGMLSDTYLSTSGRIAGLPNTENLQLDLVIDKFHTTRSDLESILPDTLLPAPMQLPQWIDLQARYNGTLQKAGFSAAVTSDVGSIETRGNMDLDSTSATRGFDIVLHADDLDVGTILGKPDSVMGTLGMRAGFKGNGLSLDEMDGKLKASVDHFEFQGYRYTDLQLEGTIRDQVASLAASMDDKNLDFAIDADYIFRDAVPRYDVTIDLKNADLRALNLSISPIRARGTLTADLATADFKVLNGNIGIRKVAVFNGDDLYAVDSLLFVTVDQEGRSEISIDSDLLQARFEGSINIFGLPTVMRRYFSSYFTLRDSLEVKEAPPQHFTFNIELRNTGLLTDLLIPDLTTFEPGPIKGEFDSETQNLDISVGIDAVRYGNVGIRSFSFTTDSDTRTLRYNLAIDKVMIDSTRIDGVELSGTVENNSMMTDLIILDSAGREKYILTGTLFSRENGFELKLATEGIVLNYQNWSVPENNYMRFGGGKFVARNVELTNLREKIIIHSGEQPGTPISVGFRELNLEYLTGMIAEERPVSGLLQGDVDLFPSQSGVTFTSDLTITDFRIRGIPWGNISLHVAQETGNRFDVNFALTGNANNIRLDGFYMGGKSPAMDIKADIGRFQLQSLQPLLVKQMRDLEGLLSGEMRVRGTPQRPDIGGRLLLRNTAFFSIFLNTNFSIDEETVSFVDEGISFDSFEVADQAGNKARLDGTILTRNYQDFRFRLDLFTDNFRLLNTTEEDNDLFYGRIDIEASARIRGNSTTPVVDMDIGLAEGSNLTYIVPQSEAAALQAEGIVKFVDRTSEGDSFMLQARADASDTVKTTFRGIDLTARIELSDQETFTIVIDPLTQDQLSIRGNATLTLQVDPTGDINLTGRYEIEEGTYKLSFYKFVKREFGIESGSYITWLGDPLNAQMNIRAIYNIETSPIGMLSNQLTGADANEVNQYRQRLPFQVYLNLTGELLQPGITFKLDMPPEERNAFSGNVYARLQDINTRESDLNKQVFALLILRRFISDDPFENKAGGGFESTARSSVSKILSEQLNRLSGNIKGVELSFDIKSYEDYTSGGQTELELGVSKSLFDDRLVVKLSGNIDIEGENPNRNATDFIGDLVLEYKVTADGRFRITGFRNSNYDMIDGELTETGAGLIYIKDYNALSELFKNNAETKN